VPDDWARFDLSDAPLARARKAAMAAAGSMGERLDVDSLFQQARAVNRAARRQGALWGAGTATLYDDGLFIGHVMVFAIATPEGEDFSLPALGQALRRPAADDASLGARSVGRVELPLAGPAVRVTGLERVAISEGALLTMVVSHTFVPVPGQPGSHLLVTGCSPNVPLRAEVVELFDAIASTFRFTGDQPLRDSGE
jgi:hypothetical protein